MRKNLKKIEGVRDIFTATFSRYGTRKNWNGFPEKTYLLKDIKDKEEKIVTDHIWIKDGKRIASLGELNEGDIIQFEARVGQYSKVSEIEEMYNGYRWYWKENDYTLKYPSNFVLLKRVEKENPPEE